MTTTKKKKVLLLNPPYFRPIMRDTFHPTSKSALYIWHPLDLLIQSGYLTDCDLQIYDGVINKNPAYLNDFLKQFRPDAVLSLISFPTLNSDLQLLKLIKEKYRAIIFAVGDITYGEKESFLIDRPYIDGILADYTSKGFAQYLKGVQIKNAAWREGNNIKSEWTHEDIDYRTPRHDLLNMNAYYLPYWQAPFASVYTSHGCPAKCKFCVAPGWGIPRFRTTDAVIEEIDFLYKRGIRKIFFRDGSFNQAPKIMINLCEQLASRYQDLKITTWFKPKPLNETMAQSMRAAGFQYVHIGVETGSADFLRKIGKDFDLHEVAPAIDLLHKYGIKVVGHFMLGVPGETKKEIGLTAKYLAKTKLDVISFSVFEYSYGISIRNELMSKSKTEDEDYAQKAIPRHADDNFIKIILIYLLSRFYCKPSRWSKIYFFESISHLMSSLPKIAQYIFDLRLYPRFRSLE
ncbi:MAG: radical SAM protein [Oligoflexia bacterium]|nr:radical SAM protein [Oligoflexia bacterium]